MTGSLFARHIAVLLGVSALLLAGCGETTAPAPSPTPSATARTASSLPFAPRTFSSLELGISFEYPREWRVQSDASQFPSSGLASVKAISRLRAERQAGITLLVKSIRVAKHESPPPYMDAPLSYRARLLEFGDATGTPVSNVRFIRLGGLRLVCYEGEARIRWYDGPWPAFNLSTRHTQDPPQPTEVIISAGAPAADWEAQRATLLAILGTMRFSPPEIAE